MVVHDIKTKEEFYSVLQDIPDGKKAVMLDCFATWCGPCKAISPILNKFSDKPEYSQIHFIKIDTDELEEVSRDLDIRAMPTFMIFEKGEKTDQFVGAHPILLEKMIKKAADKITAAEAAEAKSTEAPAVAPAAVTPAESPKEE